MVKIDGKRYYVFKEETDVEFRTDILDCEYDNDWVNIKKNGTITVKGSNRKNGNDGYAWDGCTPKIGIFDIVVGTPDGIVDLGTGKAKTYYASMIHDMIYQFSKHYKKQIKRRQADRVFLKEIKKTRFKPRYIYYIAVRLFGWYYWR